MSKKIKLAFITKNFMPEIGGGLRRIEALYNIFKSNKNIELTVITTEKEDKKNRYKKVLYIKQLFFHDKKKENITNFDANESKIKIIDKALAGWLPNVLFRIMFKKYDYVFATTPTFTNIIIGFLYKVLRFYKPKLIIEYRDFFSLNPSFIDNPEKRAAFFIEKIILKSADFVITTTSGMKKILSTIIDGKKVFLARNYISTFDIEKIKKLKKADMPKKYFNIGYVGKLNVGRNPVKILKLLELTIKKKKTALHFVGVNTDEIAYITKEAMRLKLDLKRLFFQPQVSREKSLELMKSFDSLILLINDRAFIKDGYGIPGKLYDYIYTNNSIFSDRSSFENLKSEFNCRIKKEYKDFVSFSLNDYETLDNVYDKFLNKIFNK